MPAVFFRSSSDTATGWEKSLKELIPDLDFRAWPEVGNPEDVEFVLGWKMPPGSLKQFPNLKCVCSLGQGVDHIFADPELPEGVQIMRLVDPWMSQAMSEWVLLHVLRYHRQAPEYEELRRTKTWKSLPAPDTASRKVGILGLGALGADAASKIAALGFDTAGWSRSEKIIEGVTSYHGADQLIPFMQRTEILCCLLPLTPETEGVINAETLAAMPAGSFVINSGRGGHVVEEDLLAALDSGHIAYAALDVFRTEPLPEESPFWEHPKVDLWPHVSAQTNPLSGAQQVADAITKVFRGEAPNNLVDPKTQY
ncbi:glyoxylate/hydroxypyruvate reductase A [Nisaea acidiphila]|uniref:Glyoxylate/hydroxypyruvate reductase A n=1 Tax=Nisaea acidiphila TaxID=1862145 RepID=A0A9J7APC9_9PROT|nr:glyoxylate/hydroxypyruvate reductase A [Nisaea acidiphila]UUX48196.1 glyoxylate/hydroxypyruvate reductase A [Nisaea acidiphila]